MKPAIFPYKIFFLFLLMFSQAVANAQYLPEWAKGFGGDRQDRGRAVVELASGDIILTGEASRRRTNMWLLKLRPDGTEVWGQVFEDSYYSKPNAIVINDKSEIITAGRYIKSRRKQDVNGFIMLSDSLGNPIWLREYGQQLEDEIRDLIITSSGEYVAVGWSLGGDETTKRLWFLRIDSEGEVLSEVFLWETDEDVANTVFEAADGNFIVGGYSISGERRIMRLMKMNPEGEVLWDLPFGTGDFSEIHDVFQTEDGAIYACGTYRVQPLTDYNDLLLKMSPGGVMLYMKTYGSYNWEEATGLSLTFDNYLILAGFEKSADAMTADFKIRKLDTAGTEQSLFTFRKQSLDYAEQVIETKDKGLFLVGSTYHNENGWDYAALKFKNIYRTDAEFITPESAVVSVAHPEIEVKICINSFELPEEMRLSINGSVYSTEFYNASAVPENACLYPVYLTIPLQPGINKVRVTAKDRNGYVAEDLLIVHYIPNDGLNW